MSSENAVNLLTQEYKDFISNIKSKIQNAQIKASIKVNEELLKLYWEIGYMIVEKQKLSSWGDAFIESISRDLQGGSPLLKGFSATNLKYMRKWYLFYSKSPQLVAQIFQIPWGHH